MADKSDKSDKSDKLDKSDKGNRTMWALIAWGLGLFGLILVLLIKKGDRELKLYGVQSVLLGVAVSIPSFFLGIIVAIGVVSLSPIAGLFGVLAGLVILFISFIAMLIWLYGLWKAYKFESIMLPLLGKLSEKIANKI